jgi:hypothetical protein
MHGAQVASFFHSGRQKTMQTAAFSGCCAFGLQLRLPWYFQQVVGTGLAVLPPSPETGEPVKTVP